MHVARGNENINEYTMLVGNSGGNTRHRGLRHKWEDNIKVDV